MPFKQHVTSYVFVLTPRSLGSAKIIRQPSHYILDPGPCVGEEYEIALQCDATGWPKPTYQWYRNGQILKNEKSSICKVKLFCPTNGQRTYRCIKCKMVSKTVPLNAYHVKCGNCGYRFTYKEVSLTLTLLFVLLILVVVIFCFPSN